MALGAFFKKRGYLAPPEEAEEKQPLSSMKDLYENEGPALGEYKKHISSIPQQGDYQNSFGRKLLAGAAGALQSLREGAGAGIKTTEGILSSRYKNAMGDFAAKRAGLKEAADIEQQGTNSKIKYLIDSQDLLNKEKKTGIDMYRAENDARYKDRQAGTAERNADTNAGRAEDYGRQVDSQVHEAPLRTKASLMSAAAAQSNASTNAERAKDYSRDVDIKGQRETRMSNQPAKVAGWQNKEAEQKAKMDVLQENPEFVEKYLDDKGNFDQVKITADPVGFRQFRDLIEVKKRKRLQGGDIALPDLNEAEDEDDYEVIEP